MFRIKTSGSIETSEFTSSECILPDDDDDLHIVPHDLPAKPQLQPASSAPSAPPHRPLPTPSTTVPTDTPIILNHLLTPKITTSIKNPVNIVPPYKASSARSKLTPTQPPPTISTDTICLDSDEEEMITPTVIADAAPVPVSLTVGHSPEVLATPSNIVPVNSTPSTPKTALVLRQVTSQGSAPKYILVPSKNVSKVVPKTKSVPQKEKTKTVTQNEKTKTVTQKEKTIIKPVEAVQSTTTHNPSATYLNKIKQARCLPGDIIRISEKGDIEVLQVAKHKASSVTKPTDRDSKIKPIHSDITKPKLSKNMDKPKTSESDGAKLKPNSELQKTIPNILKSKILRSEIDRKITQVQIKNNSPLSEPHKQSENQQAPKIRSLSLSSSSSESRPSTPVEHNPLSLFENVVHIQAADDKPSSSNEYKSNATKTQKIGDHNIYVQHVYATDSKSLTKKLAAKTAVTQNKDSIPKTTNEAKSSGNTIHMDEVPTKKAINSISIKKSLTTKPNKTIEKKLPLAPGLTAPLEEKDPKNNKLMHTIDLT